MSLYRVLCISNPGNALDFIQKYSKILRLGWSSREWLLSKLDVVRLKSCVSFSFQIQGIVGSGDLSSVIRIVDIYLMRCAYSYYTPSSLLLSMSSFTMLMPIPLRLEKLFVSGGCVEGSLLPLVVWTTASLLKKAGTM